MNQYENLFLLISLIINYLDLEKIYINKFLSSLIGSFVKGNYICFSSNKKKSFLKNTSLTRFFKGKLAVIHNGVDIKNKKLKKMSVI